MSRINILFIMSDQHRRDAAGCYGHPIVRTPNIDRLAGLGTQFNMAYCQSPLCAPARGAVQTGTHCHTCRALNNDDRVPIRDDVPFMGETFRQNGYVTGAFGKMHVIGETEERDLGYSERGMRLCPHNMRDYINAVGREVVEKYNDNDAGAFNPRNVPISIDEAQMFDALVVERSIRFLRAHHAEPFFLFVGLDKPHPHWLAPAEFHAMYNPDDMLLPPEFGKPLTNVPDSLRWWMEKERYLTDFPPATARNIMAAYYANVSYMDYKLGQILAAVDDLGLWENTLVVYTSDHGEMMFDHTMLQKHNLFEGSVAVPLICAGAGFPAGKQRDEIVQLIDLFPTFTEVAGLTPPAGLEGTSLVPVAAGRAPQADRAAFAEFYSWGLPWRMIRTRRWKYIYQDTEMPQLYDMVNDPRELNNVALDAACRDVRDALHDRLMADWEIPAQADMIPQHGMYPWRRGAP